MLALFSYPQNHQMEPSPLVVISVTAKIYTHMVDEVFEQNRMRMAQYAVTKSQQVESPTATN